MAFRMKMTFGEILSRIVISYIGPTEELFTLPPVIYEVAHTNKTLKIFSPSKILLDITIDDITMETILTMLITRNDDIKLERT